MPAQRLGRYRPDHARRGQDLELRENPAYPGALALSASAKAGATKQVRRNSEMNEYKLLLLPGDGIGPEVLDATMRVVGWYGQKGLPYKTEEALLGGAAIDATGRPDPDETFVKAIAADAVLMGSVGG